MPSALWPGAFFVDLCGDMICINGSVTRSCCPGLAREDREHKGVSISMTTEQKTAYEIIGEKMAVDALVHRFYDVMDSNPAYAALRGMHAQDLGPVRDSFAGFLCGWLGGPRDWLVAQGGFCVMSRHADMGITKVTAGQWLSAMREAMDELVADTALYAKLDDAFTRLTQAMSATDKAS